MKRIILIALMICMILLVSGAVVANECPVCSVLTKAGETQSGWLDGSLADAESAAGEGESSAPLLSDVENIPKKQKQKLENALENLQSQAKNKMDEATKKQRNALADYRSKGQSAGINDLADLYHSMGSCDTREKCLELADQQIDLNVQMQKAGVGMSDALGYGFAMREGVPHQGEYHISSDGEAVLYFGDQVVTTGIRCTDKPEDCLNEDGSLTRTGWQDKFGQPLEFFNCKPDDKDCKKGFELHPSAYFDYWPTSGYIDYLKGGAITGAYKGLSNLINGRREESKLEEWQLKLYAAADVLDINLLMQDLICRSFDGGGEQVGVSRRGRGTSAHVEAEKISRSSICEGLYGDSKTACEKNLTTKDYIYRVTGSLNPAEVFMEFNIYLVNEDGGKYWLFNKDGKGKQRDDRKLDKGSGAFNLMGLEAVVFETDTVYNKVCIEFTNEVAVRLYLVLPGCTGYTGGCDDICNSIKDINTRRQEVDPTRGGQSGGHNSNYGGSSGTESTDPSSTIENLNPPS